MGEGLEEAGDQSTAPVIENGLLAAFLAIRVVHLVQGAVCVASGWSTYRRPRLAAAVLGVTAAESFWLVRRAAATHTLDPLSARVDTLTGTAGLVALAAATAVEDRTTSLNWMMPLNVGAAVGLTISVGRAEGFADAAVLSGAYLATTLRRGAGSGHATTALTNALSYGGFHAVGRAVIDRGRREGSVLDATRAESAARAERLAIETERNRQHRLLHDSALQTLEAIANGLVGEPAGAQARARQEANRLRRALAGIEPDSDLDQALSDLAAEAAGLGVEVEHSIGSIPDLQPAVVHALADATREALRNVAKHAETNCAVVRADGAEGGVRVTVRDHGVGFDADSTGPGFGLSQSVHARLAEVGGRASVWSVPGRGCRLTMWVPGP
ncbi:MAG: liaS [Acidimicrobiales bacterium]|nr:liaS [Acidimicrobiales bacterium]